MLHKKYDIAMSSDEFKKYKGIRILKKESFKCYSKRLEKDHDEYTRIIRCSSLSEVDKDDVDKRLEDGDDILMYDEQTYFKLTKKRIGFTVGYIAISDQLFIRVTTWFPIIILSFLGLLCLLISLRGCTPTAEDPVLPSETFDPNLDEDATDYTGQQPKNPSEQESTVIPGFFKFTASQSNPYIQLYNPEDNTVYFQYEIYEVVNTESAGFFETVEAANKFINDNQIDYKSYETDDRFEIRDKDGNVLDEVKVYSITDNLTNEVTCETCQIRHVTGLIEPGKQVMWNVCDILGTGEYQFKFKISTYDTETGSECYGAIQAVTGIIK